MHTTFIPALKKLQIECSQIGSDPASFMCDPDPSNNNLFDYMVYVIDNIHMPLISDRFLTKLDILNLHEKHLMHPIDIDPVPYDKIIAMNELLCTKLLLLLHLAEKAELWEVVKNIILYFKTGAEIEEDWI